MERNDYQNKFLQYIAQMQDTVVNVKLAEYKLYEHEDYEKIRKFLFDVTFEMIVNIMVMIDGYSSFTDDKLDIINTRTGEGLKQNPFIELHDDICDFIKY